MTDPVAPVREQEAADQRLAFNDTLRQAGRRNKITFDTTRGVHQGALGREPASVLADALANFEEAKATGDPAQIEAADREVERRLDEARAAAKRSAPDWGGGARPARQEPPGFNEWVREQWFGWPA